MRSLLLFILIIISASALSAQMFPAKYYKEAYFTNYHRQKVKGKLQKDFSTPIKVLQHLMRSETMEDFSKILEEPYSDLAVLEKKQISNVFPFTTHGKFGDDFDGELDYLIEYEYNDYPMAIIGYHLLLNGKPVNHKYDMAILSLIKKGGNWFLYELSLPEKNWDRSVIARIGRTFSYLNADNWEYLITGKGANINTEMKEMRYFIVDEKGINVSKFKDLTLYWGIKEGKKRMEELYYWPPFRKFFGWDESIHGVSKWFDRRNNWTLADY